MQNNIVLTVSTKKKMVKTIINIVSNIIAHGLNHGLSKIILY
jgi:hypothetical protein